MIIEKVAEIANSGASVTFGFNDAPQPNELILVFWRSNNGSTPSGDAEYPFDIVVSNAGGSSVDDPHIHLLSRVTTNNEPGTYTLARSGPSANQQVIAYRLSPFSLIGNSGIANRLNDITTLPFSDTPVAMSDDSTAFGLISTSGSITNLTANNSFTLDESSGRLNVFTRDISAVGDYNGTASWDGSIRAGGVLVEVVNPPTDPLFTLTDDQGNPTNAVFDGRTITVTTSNWGETDPTHVEITDTASTPNTLTLPLTATATPDVYEFTMPQVSEVEGESIDGLFAGAGSIRLYTGVGNE